MRKSRQQRCAAAISANTTPTIVKPLQAAPNLKFPESRSGRDDGLKDGCRCSAWHQVEHGLPDP
jgi:hypothetical protein